MLSFATVAILLLVAFTFHTLFTALTSPLRHIPGPFLARFTRLWELHAQRSGKLAEIHIDLHKRYGPVVRLAPNRYSLASPAAAKIIYGNETRFPKTSYYKAFGVDHGDNIFSVRDPGLHAAERRLISPLYSMSALVGYEENINRCTATLISKFSEFARDGVGVTMREWLQFYAYDVVGEITFSESFGIMHQGKDLGILHDIDLALLYGTLIGLIPEWHIILDNVLNRLRPNSTVEIMVVAAVEKRLKAQSAGEDDPTPNDFLSKLLGLLRSGRITQRIMQTTIGANIGAGSDTTGIALSSVVLELARNPIFARKLQAEIAQFETQGKLSDPVTFAEAQQMPYLQAVIKEGLRIHPAVGQIMPRYVPAEGMELDGQYFPAGTTVGVNAWVLHRDIDIFGADADSFRPERWLQSKEISARMDQYNLSFGAGSRTCIGKNISLIEMNKVLPQLFRTFDFELTSLEPNQSDWFVKQNFECRIKLRDGQRG